MKRAIGIARGPVLRAGLVIGVAVTTLVALAAPAWSCSAIISGSTTCSDGAHVVTWTIGNSESDKVMTINYALAATPTDVYAVTGFSATVGYSGSTSATTVVPYTQTGQLNIDVSASWSNGSNAVDFASVNLGDTCPGPPATTSTTTTTQPSTTTTAAPPTTATTPPTNTSPPTNTTPTTETPTTRVAATTIVVTTTAPRRTTTTQSTITIVRRQGGGPVTTTTKPGAGAKELPFTGSSTDSVIFFGLVALASGGALLLHKRSAMPLHTGCATSADVQRDLERRRRALTVYLPRR